MTTKVPTCEKNRMDRPCILPKGHTGHCWNAEEQHAWGSREECQRIHDEIKKEQEEHQKQMDSIFKELETIKGESFVKELIEYAQYNYKITDIAWVKEPSGDRQEEDDIQGCPCWVDQSINGGHTGDYFAGDIYYKIEEGKFLRVGYDCG